MAAGKGNEALLRSAAACISDAVGALLPMTSADTAAINALTPDRGGGTLPEQLAQQRIPMTAGLWAVQIRVVAAQWETSAAQDFAVVLPYLLERYPCSEEAPYPAVLPHATAALAGMACHQCWRTRPHDDERDGGTESECLDFHQNVADGNLRVRRRRRNHLIGRVWAPLDTASTDNVTALRPGIARH